MRLDLALLLKWEFPDLNGAGSCRRLITHTRKEALPRVVHGDLRDLSVQLGQLRRLHSAIDRWSWWHLNLLALREDGPLVANG